MNEKTKMIIEEYAASQTQTAETLLMELGNYSYHSGLDVGGN